MTKPFWIRVGSDSQPHLLLYTTPPDAAAPIECMNFTFEAPLQMYMEWHQQLHHVCTVEGDKVTITRKTVCKHDGLLVMEIRQDCLYSYDKEVQMLECPPVVLKMVDVSQSANWFSGYPNAIRSIEYGALVQQQDMLEAGKGYLFTDDVRCTLVEVIGKSAAIIDVEDGYEIRVAKIPQR